MYSLLFLKGKIQELLPGNSIDAQTRLVLVNAIYFKGKWKEQFDKTNTSEMPFKINQVGEAFTILLVWWRNWMEKFNIVKV